MTIRAKLLAVMGPVVTIGVALTAFGTTARAYCSRLTAATLPVFASTRTVVSRE